jgi:iron complex transport system ATP-binding protein
VFGHDLPAYTPRELARVIAYVPQTEQALFDFTVRQVVMMGRHPHISRYAGEQAADYEAVARAMALADVVHLADRPVTALSGGEHRRVLIARAIAQEAPLLMLDEPTAHLDMSHQFEILRLMSSLCKKSHSAVIAALHDLNLAADHCDRLLLLSHGSLIADGTPEEVLQREALEDAYGASVVVVRNPISGRPLVAPTSAKQGEAVQTRVHVVCGGGTGAEVMAELLRLGCEVSTGVLNRLDSDQEAAQALGIPCVEEAPYSAISDAAYALGLDAAMHAEFLIVTDMPVGRGNVRNLDIAKSAALSGVKLILLSEGAIEQRDFTGGEAATLWSDLERLAAAIVRSPQEACAAIRRSVADQTPVSH